MRYRNYRPVCPLNEGSIGLWKLKLTQVLHICQNIFFPEE